MYLPKGKIIVFEGIDKAGKTTQAKLLEKKLGSKCVRIDFPDYSTPVGNEIKQFLDGKRNYPDEVKMTLLSANRWEKKGEIEKIVGKGTTLIMNRYCQSNLVYGISKGLKLDWLLSLDKGLPKADLVIVIDIRPKTLVSRSKNVVDTFEKDLELIRRVKKNYRILANKFNWRIVDGEKSVDEVHSQVLKIVKKFVKI
ncbi:MAG TPA: dTMP kinase [Nitrososphaeraceae archaeon]|jgi:dTMP kinase|nr:dTMP kinase [Nitrososphaeraceae archaeon]